MTKISLSYDNLYVITSNLHGEQGHLRVRNTTWQELKHWQYSVRDCQECIATIWCLCNKTNKLKKTKEEGHQAELSRPEKGAASGYAEGTRKTECSASGLGSRGVASGVAGGSSGRQPVTLDYYSSCSS